MALDQDKGVWKSAKGKGRRTPKGRQFEDEALNEVKALLENRPRQKDLLIEFLHLIQDKYGYLSAQHLCALAEELKISMAEVYEVASFYAHFDIVKEDETPPPQITIRVCDSLSCELAGAEKLREELKKGLDLLAKGKAIDYEGATAVKFTDVGEHVGNFIEKEIKGGKFKNKKQR